MAGRPELAREHLPLGSDLGGHVPAVALACGYASGTSADSLAGFERTFTATAGRRGPT